MRSHVSFIYTNLSQLVLQTGQGLAHFLDETKTPHTTFFNGKQDSMSGDHALIQCRFFLVYSVFTGKKSALHLADFGVC